MADQYLTPEELRDIHWTATESADYEDHGKFFSADRRFFARLVMDDKEETRWFVFIREEEEGQGIIVLTRRCCC